VSADYDKITGFFEDLEFYLNRLKILEKDIPPIPELEVAVVEVLTSVLVLCGICAKYVKMKRIGNYTFTIALPSKYFFSPKYVVPINLTTLCLKNFLCLSQRRFSDRNKHSATDINVSSVKALRNLVSGEDDELTTAYTHFHKMVEQEQGAVRNATLAAVEQLKRESTAMHVDVREGLAVTERTDLNTKTLIASTERMHGYLESMRVLRIYPLWCLSQFTGQEAALERDDILTRLSSLDFHEKQRDIFAKHHQGTGQWLLKTDEFQRWFKSEQPSILWCPGIRTPIFR
jgi:hypothetical protein